MRKCGKPGEFFDFVSVETWRREYQTDIRFVDDLLIEMIERVRLANSLKVHRHETRFLKGSAPLRGECVFCSLKTRESKRFKTIWPR